MLTSAGFTATVAKDGVEALKALRAQRFDLLLLDVWMPRMNGLELLTKLRASQGAAARRGHDVGRCAADAARGRARAGVQVRAQAGRAARAAADRPRRRSPAPEPPPIEVISARPEWVELVVPCTREAAERIQTVMAQLDADLLEPELRESIGYAFRELLLNAVEWGGRLDPKRKVRIACLRTQADADVPDCRSRPGLQDRRASARGDRPVVRRSDRAHARARGERASGRAASAC